MKKLKVNKRMLTMLLGGTMLMGTMTGCAQFPISDFEFLTESKKTVYEPGEHIVMGLFPMKKRFEYHEGYEIVAISNGDMNYVNVIYQNVVPVECTEVYSYDSSRNWVNEDYLYIEFGTPVELEQTDENVEKEKIAEGDTKTFKPGEHIITDTINSSGIGSRKLDYHEGYEVVGATKLETKTGVEKTVIIYRNTVPVECVAVIYDDEYNNNVMGTVKRCDYVEFGTPVELQKTQAATYKLN